MSKNKEDNEVVYKAYCLVAENKNQHWFQDLSIKEAMFIIDTYDLKVEINLSGQFLSTRNDKLQLEEYAVPLRIAATKEALKNDISVDWCVCGSEIEELDLGNVVRWWPRKWLFGKQQTMPEHIRIDYGIVSKKHLIIDLEVVTDVSKNMIEKSFGDIVTEAEFSELKRIELSKMNLKTENRVNKNAVIVEKAVTATPDNEEIREVGDMGIFGKKKEKVTDNIVASVEGNSVISSEADEALDTVNNISESKREETEQSQIVYPYKFKETTYTTSKTENKVHKEDKMNEETQTQKQETSPAPRKRLTTKRVVVTTGIVLGAATLITTGVVCWKKFHK